MKIETVREIIHEMGYREVAKQIYKPGYTDNNGVWVGGTWSDSDTEKVYQFMYGMSNELKILTNNIDRQVLYKMRTHFATFIAFTSKANHTNLIYYRIGLKTPYYVNDSKVSRLDDRKFDEAIQYCKDHPLIEVQEEYDTEDYNAIKILK